MVLTIGAALLVFTPKNIDLPFETIASNITQEPDAIIPPYSYVPPAYQPLDPAGEQQSSSLDAVDLVRNPGAVPGLVTPTEGANSQGNETGRSTEIVINVTQPTTVAVPTTPPTGRAANESTSTSTSTAGRPAQTTSTPSASTPTQTATGSSQKTTGSSQTASTPAQTASKPSTSTASKPTQTTSTPTQTASRPSTPTQTTPVPVALTQPSAAQTRTNDDFWVQTGAFSTIASAEGVKETLASKGITSIIENGNIDGRTLFRVRVGPYVSRNEANYWLALIKSIDGFEDSQVRTTENLR